MFASLRSNRGFEGMDGGSPLEYGSRTVTSIAGGATPAVTSPALLCGNSK